MMTPEMIEQIALANGFKLKKQPDGSMALNPYVFEFAKALLALAPQTQNTSYLKETGINNDRDMLNELHAAFENQVYNCECCGHAEPTSTFDSASMLRDYLAANPVPPATREQ